MRSFVQSRGYWILFAFIVFLCVDNSQQIPQEEGNDIFGVEAQIMVFQRHLDVISRC